MGWISAILVLVLACCVVAYWQGDANDHEAEAQRACDHLRRLDEARLRGDARKLLAKLEKAETTGECKGELPTREQFDEEDRLAATALVRAKIYRRAARLKRTAGIREGQRAAIRRARRAYMASLRLDPYNVAARRGLMLILAGRLGPGSRIAANERCRLARRLQRADLLQEAALVYAQALRTGRTTRCLRFALRDTRRQRGRAVALQRRGEAAASDAAGKRAARRDYARALALDPSLGVARAKLAALPTPDPEETGFLARIGDGFSDMAAWLKKASDDLAGKIAGVVLLLVGVLALAVLLSHALLLGTEGSTGFRNLVDKAPFLRRFSRTHITLESADDNDASTLVLATIADTFEKGKVPTGIPPATIQARPLPDSVGIGAGADGDALQGVATVLGALGGGDVITNVVTWVRKSVARRQVRVVCHLLPASAQGVALRIGVRDRRDRPVDSMSRSAATVPGGVTSDDDAYHALAIKGGEWLREVRL